MRFHRTTALCALRRLLLVAIASAAIATQFGNGCSIDGSSGGSGPPPYDRVEDREARPNRIPRSADVVREGRERLRWQSDMNGHYYVYDPARNRVLYDDAIRRGETLVVDPKRDRILVDEKEVFHGSIKSDGFHRIFFTADRPSGGSRDRVPRDAESLVHGRGNLAIHQAPADGTVFLYDNDADRIVFQREIRRGNSFQIFPSANYINVNSRKVADVPLNRDGRYTLYFQRK